MSYISAYTNRRTDTVIVWERDKDGDRVEQHYDAPYYFYVSDPEGKYKTIFDRKDEPSRVSKLTFESGREYYTTRKAIQEEGDLKLWESDIPPEIRVLSNHYYGIPAPKLNVTFLDIEVDYDPDIGFSSTRNPYAPINAISLYHTHEKRMVTIAIPPPNDGIDWTPELLAAACNDILPVPDTFKTEYYLYKTERELLLKIIEEIYNSDLLCGWNSETFDFPYIAKRMEIVLGEKSLRHLSFPGADIAKFEEVETPYGPAIKLNTSGRMLADYMQLYKKYEFGERASYKLASIEQEVGLGLPKLEYEGNLADLYNNDFAFFVRYNIRDCEILDGFEQKLAYVELANQMYHMSCGLFTHVLGTLKLAELAIVNYCHHELKRVVKNITEPEIDRGIDGALVLLPQAGMHEWIGSVDINSLYPSAIRSINISPETLRGQFTKDVADAACIANDDDVKMLTLRLEDGTEITKTGAQFRTWLKAKQWAISGYGTVFDQSAPGIIPTILADWYAQRKKFQKLKKETTGEQSDYYDRLQYVYKIKLNSLYGALTNQFFRFYDLRMGESTTGTGRMIVQHQARQVNKYFGGDYNINFPLYATVKEAVEKGKSPDIALDGPLFKGKFQSETVVTGDTDSCYFKTYADNKEDAIRIADAVADYVNESYPIFMRQQFLCGPEFDKIILCGREIVCDRGIFVEKKRYILHLVNLDGKDCDKMKVMGLDIKKTTIPKAVSEKIEGFIEDLLKGKDWLELSHEVVEFKSTLRGSVNVLDVGLPKGCNGIEDYTKDIQIYGEGARVPGHVRAAIYYNTLVDRYGDKNSPKIISGNKIKVYYLTRPEGKFKSIALPTDIEMVPKWFLDEVVPIIDFNAQIQRLIDNPMDNIVRAIGRKTPTKHSILVDTVLVF